MNLPEEVKKKLETWWREYYLHIPFNATIGIAEWMYTLRQEEVDGLRQQLKKAFAEAVEMQVKVNEAIAEIARLKQIIKKVEEAGFSIWPSGQY